LGAVGDGNLFIFLFSLVVF